MSYRKASGAFASTLLAVVAFFYSSITSAQSGSISFDSSEYYVTEGQTLKIPLIRSGGSSGEVTVDIRIRSGSATGGRDFGRTEGSPTDFNLTRRWINGEVQDRTHGGHKTVNIDAYSDDDDYEYSESFVIEMVGIRGGNYGAITSANVYIEDGYSNPWVDDTSVISFERAVYNVTEGQSLKIPMIRSGSSSGEVKVDIRVRGISASGGVDFGRSEGNLTDFNLSRRWIDGEVTDRTSGGLKTVNFDTFTDSDIWEGTETFELEMVQISGGDYGAITKVTVNIEDSYDPWAQTGSTISFERSEYTISEGSAINIPMVRSDGSNGEVSVDVRVRGITASGGSDFGRAEGNPTDFSLSRRWLNGEVRDRTTGGLKTVNFDTYRDDNIWEGTESFELEMVQISGGSLGYITKVTVNIEDRAAEPTNGNAGSVSFERAEYRVTEGNVIRVPMVRSGGSRGEVKVNINIQGITASQGADFVRAEGDPREFSLSRRWINGEVQDRTDGGLKTVNIKALSDNATNEGTETLILRMVNITGGSLGSITTATVYIDDAGRTPSGSNCVYPGGDSTQWGWDAVASKSCAPGNGRDDTTTNPSTNNPSTISPDSNCDYPGGDTSKWGWNNVTRSSCAPVDDNPIMNNPFTPAPQPGNSCVYPGGDRSKWGWDSVAGQSCKPASNTTNSIAATSDSCVYPGGDTSQWGWDNVANSSCKPRR